MKVFECPSLGALHTFGVDASAQLLIVIESEEDLLSVPSFDPARDFVLGGGSNVIFVTDVPGTVFQNRILGRGITQTTSEHALLEAGAGENWHDLVRWSLDQGLAGIENLSLIPGQAGAAPIQNIGAYGVELSSVLHGVTAWDWQRCSWTHFDPAACRLSYRDSLFKGEAVDRYLITSIQLHLDRVFHPRLDYAGLREELAESCGDNVSATDVSDAVIRLRRRKLPDPAVNGNAGSFFKNPQVDLEQAEALVATHPGLPVWPATNGRAKLSAAWMIECCGLKGARAGDAAVSTLHALVLVNLGAATGADVLTLAERVQKTVAEEFGVNLEPEPRLVEFPS